MSTFLLEIGTEEIPHWMIPGALDQLSRLNLLGATPHVDATPRRLVVRATDVPARTPDTEEVLLGPAPGVGTSVGPPMDRATEGWIKKNNITSPIYLRQTDKGMRWAATRERPGRDAKDILAETLPTAILGIQWPKTMYWGTKGSPRFIRPIRWIVALLGDDIIDFEVAGVKSGNLSRGHRVLANTPVEVDYASIEAVLRANHVILSASERRAKIETEARALGATIEPELLETLTYITEFPAAIKGDFDPAYLELPAEVLTMVMRHHQKYFAVETAPGVLAPHFVAVMNIPGDPDGLVKQGNERVLKARFNDARFFWEVDQKKKLADRVEDLSHVTFQAKLGTYLEKTHRVVALVKELRGDEHAQRAALLAKADLTTEMVKEFTDLQGIVGGLYAKHQGEPKAVNDAIYEHYKPLSMEDSIPSTKAGQILAIADKLDNLREFFRIDMVPTGSKDPFALRRAAQGIVKILVEAKLPYTLQFLMDNEFMRERLQYYFREIRGFKYDEVNAVMSAGVATLTDVEARLVALAQVRPTPDFEPLAASFKRINNILKQANFETPSSVAYGWNASRAEDADQRLRDEYLRVSSMLDKNDYGVSLRAIASLRPAIDSFFNETLVNAPDPSVRIQRLSLLSFIRTDFSTIADFSEIVTSGDQK